jgi:hypothetical protein
MNETHNLTILEFLDELTKEREVEGLFGEKHLDFDWYHFSEIWKEFGGKEGFSDLSEVRPALMEIAEMIRRGCFKESASIPSDPVIIESALKLDMSEYEPTDDEMRASFKDLVDVLNPTELHALFYVVARLWVGWKEKKESVK